jgi:ribosomal protein S18 acetylase RimI-like enzyme
VVSASDLDVRIARLGEPRPLERADVDRAARVFARAFAWHEPWGAWAMPDTSTREDRLFNRVRSDLIGRFLRHAECWTIGGASNTIWFPPGVPALASRRSESDYATYGEIADDLRAGDQLIASLKPSEPHWYLDTIATDPDLFGHGLAGRLLAHDLEVRDAAGHWCALDTHTPRQVAFYERHGFEVTGRGRLGSELEVVMMIREPPASRP